MSSAFRKKVKKNAKKSDFFKKNRTFFYIISLLKQKFLPPKGFSKKNGVSKNRNF